MKIDFAQNLKLFTGKTMALTIDGQGEQVPATLGAVAVEALSSPRVDNGQPQPMQGTDHVRNFSLAQRIFEAAEPIELTAEEVVVVKQRIAEHYIQPLVVGQAWQLLDA